MPSLPDSAGEALRWVVIIAAAAILAIVGFYAVNALAAMGVTLVALIVLVLVGWIVLGRLWDTLRHGKPLFRGDWRGGGGSGD